MHLPPRPIGSRNMNSYNAGLQARRRSQSGTMLAELPFVLWMLFVFLLFPLLIVASIGYRGSVLYYAASQATNKAGKASTYTNAGSKAASVLTADLAPFTGISASPPVVSIVVKPLAGGSPTIYTAPLAAGTVNTSTYLYFIKTQTDADLSPLVQFNGSWMGMPIPGLTGPYHLTFNMESYAENPSGLTQ